MAASSIMRLRALRGMSGTNSQSHSNLHSAAMSNNTSTIMSSKEVVQTNVEHRFKFLRKQLSNARPATSLGIKKSLHTANANKRQSVEEESETTID